MRTWYIASGLNRDSSPCLSFTAQETGQINEWLTRLERTRDFQGNQRSLAQTICQMLETTQVSPDFKEMFLVQVGQNNTACEDRSAMALNELYTGWKLTTLPEEATLQEKLAILVAGAKTLALRSFLATQITANQGSTGTLLQESVEIYLYYETAFALPLRLLSFIRSTRYAEGMGKRPWIDIEELTGAVNSTYLDHLVDLRAFQKIAEANPLFVEERKSLNIGFNERENLLLDKYSIPEMYAEEIEKLGKEKAFAEKQLLKKWFIQNYQC